MKQISRAKLVVIALLVVIVTKVIQLWFPPEVDRHGAELVSAIRTNQAVAETCGEIIEVTPAPVPHQTTYFRRGLTTASGFTVVGRNATVSVKVEWQEIDGVFSITSIRAKPM